MVSGCGNPFALCLINRVGRHILLRPYLLSETPGEGLAGISIEASLSPPWPEPNIAGIPGKRSVAPVRRATVAPSMRRPPKSRINLPWYRKSSSPTNGRRQEASVSLPSKKGFDFPRASDSAVGRPTGGAARILPFTSSPSPIRPASIRTLVVEHLLRCRLGSSIIQIGCCHLGTELNVSVSSYARSSATSQSPELGD